MDRQSRLGLVREFHRGRTANFHSKAGVYPVKVDSEGSMKDLSTAISDIRSGLLPKLSVGEERPYNEQDFANHLPRSHASLATCLELVKECELEAIRDISVAAPVILLCGEHTEASRPWTQGKHVQLAYQAYIDIKVTLSF